MGWKPTGTNVVPLGKRSRASQFFDDDDVDQLSPHPPSPPSHSPPPPPPPPPPTSDEPDRQRSNDQPEEREGRRRKRRSRWGDETNKVSIPGMPSVLPSNMSKEQSELYVIYMRLEEINRKLRTGDYIPPEPERSPSPEPVYNSDGKRVNTREFRYRKKFEDERTKIIESAIKNYPTFKPPADYKRPTKIQEKVYIPAREYPEINFIGLLIGPRGNTLKKMETESNAKISIRGKGSVKEGKSRQDGAMAPGQDEDLHCLITADDEEKVKKAIKMINKIIETSSSVPEGQNELKRQQLRELAALNGTLRDDENQTCTNCGGVGHRKYECPDTQNFTVNLVCRICNGVGHTARDCIQRNNPEALEQARQRDQQLDHEYLSLMAELGENVPEGAAPARPYGESIPPPPGLTGHYGPLDAAAAAPLPPAGSPPTGWVQPPPNVAGAAPAWNYGYAPPPGSSYPSYSGVYGNYAPDPSAAAYVSYEGYGTYPQTATYQPPPPPGASTVRTLKSSELKI
ncbi:Branchpoint-bridging protein, variant 3 [Basidiobolus ranarum]|uniref:Branchpoint-bridging protein n=1 Tax=Basidiobolus ranarum TaxID=34480 RepID=A0ABR2X0E6_9FUNG